MAVAAAGAVGADRAGAGPLLVGPAEGPGRAVAATGADSVDFSDTGSAGIVDGGATGARGDSTGGDVRGDAEADGAAGALTGSATESTTGA